MYRRWAFISGSTAPHPYHLTLEMSWARSNSFVFFPAVIARNFAIYRSLSKLVGCENQKARALNYPMLIAPLRSKLCLVVLFVHFWLGALGALAQEEPVKMRPETAAHSPSRDAEANDLSP